MIVAINTRVITGNEVIRQRLIRQFQLLAKQHPEHQFVFISAADKQDPTIDASPNVRQLLLPQRSTNPLLWKFWYSYTMPNAVKKLQASVLINADATAALRTKLPQVMLVNELAFQQHPHWYAKKAVKFMQANWAKFVEKASRIITSDEGPKAMIAKQFPAKASAITILPLVADALYEPIDSTAAEMVKEQYTGGKEYFLFAGSIHARSELINLLKAFSIFKKRQKSNMQLILATSEPIFDSSFTESLRLYKFRADVQLIQRADDATLQSLTAAAYAAIHLAPLESDIASLLNAIQCRVPVIAGDWDESKEQLGEAAVYVKPGDPGSIAAYLMLLYKDETHRKELIAQGQLQMADRSAETSADLLWQLLLNTIAAV